MGFFLCSKTASRQIEFMIMMSKSTAIHVSPMAPGGQVSWIRWGYKSCEEKALVIWKSCFFSCIDVEI